MTAVQVGDEAARVVMASAELQVMSSAGDNVVSSSSDHLLTSQSNDDLDERGRAAADDQRHQQATGKYRTACAPLSVTFASAVYEPLSGRFADCFSE